MFMHCAVDLDIEVGKKENMQIIKIYFFFLPFVDSVIKADS